MNSVSNRQLTLLRKLNRKKYRYRERLFLIEGARAVQQVIANNAVKVECLFFDKAQHYASKDAWRQLAGRLDAALIGEKDFAEVSDTDNPQGVLALCRMPDELPVDKMAGREGLIIAFDAVRDPGNAGTIVRTASWFGAAGILSGKGTVDLFHPKVVRSTAGATGAIPCLNGELPEMLPSFEEQGWSVVLLSKSGHSVPLSSVKSSGKTIIVVGNEAHGIDSALVNEGRVQAEIPAVNPGSEHVESLNAAIAASIALYHFSAK